MLKTVIKYAKEDQVRHRIVPADAVAKSLAKIAGIQDDITEILQEEREERLVRLPAVMCTDTGTATPSGYGSDKGPEHGQT